MRGKGALERRGRIWREKGMGRTKQGIKLIEYDGVGKGVVWVRERQREKQVGSMGMNSALSLLFS